MLKIIIEVIIDRHPKIKFGSIPNSLDISYLIKFPRFIHTFLCLLQPLVEHSTNSVYYSRPLMLKPRTTLIHLNILLAGTSRIFTRWPISFWLELRISWHLSQNFLEIGNDETKKMLKTIYIEQFYTIVLLLSVFGMVGYLFPGANNFLVYFLQLR